MSDREPMPQLDLDLQLCFQLYAATRAVTRRYAVLLEEFGLTYPQYLTLLALWGADGRLSVGELGTRLRLDSGTLTPLLKRLESAGLVDRRRDAEDERRVLVEVTDDGWSMREQIAGVPDGLFSAMGITMREAKDLRRLLGDLVAHLDEAERADAARE